MLRRLPSGFPMSVFGRQRWLLFLGLDWIATSKCFQIRGFSVASRFRRTRRLEPCQGADGAADLTKTASSVGAVEGGPDFPPLESSAQMRKNSSVTSSGGSDPSGLKVKNSQSRSLCKRGELGGRALSLSQALYLAKEADVFTVKELQKIVLTSPSFSTGDSPFLLENFFSSMEDREGDRQHAAAAVYEDDALSFHADEVDDQEAVGDAFASNGQDGRQVERLLRASIHNAFDKAKRRVFFFNGREWLAEASGQGTRKRAAAHVTITRGTGQVRVCGREDAYIRWPYIYDRLDIFKPFVVARALGAFDVSIDVRGGGPTGQAMAARLAIGRALVHACPDCKEDLEKEMILYEDTRQRMPKMPGRMKARKQRQWSKR